MPNDFFKVFFLYWKLSSHFVQITFFIYLVVREDDHDEVAEQGEVGEVEEGEGEDEADGCVVGEENGEEDELPEEGGDGGHDPEEQ